jgi:hypothetical protein
MMLEEYGRRYALNSPAVNCKRVKVSGVDGVRLLELLWRCMETTAL